MVYCNYKSHTANTVTYTYGGFASDLTGEFTASIPDGKITISKEPERSYASFRHIQKVVNRAMGDFKEGVYPEKLSYEI